MHHLISYLILTTPHIHANLWQMTINETLAYICCPLCKADLLPTDANLRCVSCNAKYKIINENILSIVPNITEDIKLSIDKWDQLYKSQLENTTYDRDLVTYEQLYFADVKSQLVEAKVLTRDVIYLEIGCGPFFLGQKLAKDVKLIIGIDFSPAALQIAKTMLDAKGITNYILIQGDILSLPLKDNTVDLIYGGGVLEHFKDTVTAVKQLYCVLRSGGVSFNTVPYLNIGTLTYRQLWGNIPNFFGLKQLAEFIHIKLLKGRHMIFGYEFSFLESTIKRIHKQAGFKQITVARFKVQTVFDFIPKIFRKFAAYLCNSSRLFWPMIKVIAQK